LRVSQIQVRGNVLTREAVIRRELVLAPGDPLSREKLLESQRRLYRLGLFRNVRLTHGPVVAAEPEAQLVDVHVEESPPLVGSVSAGFDTEAGIKGGVALAHENVFGRGVGLGLQARASNLERLVQLSASEPRLFGRSLRGTFNLGWEEREEVGFSYDRTSASTRVDRRLSEIWSGFLRYTFQDVNILTVEDPEELAEEKLEDVRLGDVGAAFVRDRRDDPLLFRRGTYLTLSSNLFAQPLLSDRSFVKQGMQFSFAVPLKAGIGWASSVRTGGELPFGSGERATVPISESFFLGGDATLRGFERDELGPGEAMLLLNTELRFPLWKSLKASVFYDAGNVYPDLSNIDLDLRHVLGVGLRLETPIGPLRVEYGAKLDRQDEESKGEVFFAIGSAF
jgi:outer membrane protein assembly complex protein YaeT